MKNYDAVSPHQNSTEIEKLKTLTGVVYLCQVMSFAMAGLPLLIGVAINLVKKEQVKGTWLESHFEWQIKTAWVALALFAVSGLTFFIGLGYFMLVFAVLWLAYRIVLGWHTLFDNQPIERNRFH
ncbi:MAG: membrane protein [Methylomicrobium sp.]